MLYTNPNYVRVDIIYLFSIQDYNLTSATKGDFKKLLCYVCGMQTDAVMNLCHL